MRRLKPALHQPTGQLPDYKASPDSGWTFEDEVHLQISGPNILRTFMKIVERWTSITSPHEVLFSTRWRENFLFKVLLSTKTKVGMAQNSDSFVQNTAACVWNKDKFVSNDNIQYLIRGFSSDRPSVRNAQGTLPGFWNGLDWRALVKY